MDMSLDFVARCKTFSLLLIMALCWTTNSSVGLRIAGQDEGTAAESPTPPKEDASHSWTYSDQVDWSKEYPLCGGKNMRQSPIDIELDNVRIKPSYSLQFIDYNQSLNFSLKNTHHSVSLRPNPLPNPPTLRLNWVGEAPGSDFILQEVHFHWGDELNKGSEHEINGEPAAAEMHMVHYKAGLTADDIGNVDNSVVVIGVFIESDNQAHNSLESIVADAASVNGTDSDSETPDSISLMDLLPDHYQSFYTYEGSLTTPPCLEVVTWIVMSSPVYMSNERLEELSCFEASGPEGIYRINANHRDVQPLENRPVYASFNVTDSVSPDLKTVSDETFHGNFDSYWHNMQSLAQSFEQFLRQMQGPNSPLPSPNPGPVPYNLPQPFQFYGPPPSLPLPLPFPPGPNRRPQSPRRPARRPSRRARRRPRRAWVYL